MIVLGLLLVLGAAGLVAAAIWANDGVFTAPAGTVELFGGQLNTTVGQMFLAGAAMGALALLGLGMLLSGLRRSSKRRSAGRRQQRDHRHEMQDLQRKHDVTSSDLAAHRANSDAESEGDKVAARQ